jgi:glycosidase
VPFAVHAPLARAGRFRGFDANDVIYLIMPDRSPTATPRTTTPAVSRGILDRANPRRYHGGDLAGVRARLPVPQGAGRHGGLAQPDLRQHQLARHDRDGRRQPTTAYHGYHAVDYYGVEERFGDSAEVRRLVDEAHAQGIKVIFDMVANHTSAYHPWVDDSPTPTWYNGTRRSHLANPFQGWTIADPYSPPAVRRATLDGWFVNFLPDLNQGDPEVARYLTQNTLWWVGATGSTASGRTPGSTCRAPSGATG